MAKQRVLLRASRCLALAAVLCVAPRCFGEFVVVKVVNGKSGAPVSDQSVTVQLHYERITVKHHFEIRRKTDSAGEVHFEVPDIKPDSIDIDVDYKEPGFRCSCQVLADPQTVLQKGVVVAQPRHHENAAQARPGYILFVSRPVSKLEKIILDY